MLLSVKSFWEFGVGVRPFCFASGVVACFLFAGVAAAQASDPATRTAARALGTAGVEAYEDGQYEAASEKLEKAFGILKVPSLGLWSARALERRGLWTEALDRYLEAASIQVPAGELAVQQSARRDAEQEAEALKARIPRLVISVQGVEPGTVALTIDGRSVGASVIGQPRLINPGSHRVEAAADGRRTSGEVSCVEGKEASLALDLRATVEPSSATRAQQVAGPPGDRETVSAGTGRWQSTLGWVALGAGAVGVAVGSLSGVKALSERKTLDDSGLCVEDRCPTSTQDSVDNLATYRTISTIGFVAGGVLAAAGITLVLTAPSSRTEAALYFAPGAAGLRGSF